MLKNIEVFSFLLRDTQDFQYCLTFVHLQNSKRDWNRPFILVCDYTVKYTPNTLKTALLGSVLSVLSHTRYLCQTPSRDWPPLLSISRARKHRLPLLSSFQQLLRNSPTWHIWKENFFPQNFASIYQERLGPYQLSPNSYTFNKIPNVMHSLCGCWSFPELHKHQRIFLLSFHCYKITSADPLLNWPQEYPHLQFAFRHHLHWTMVFDWIYCGFYKIITFSWFQKIET